MKSESLRQIHIGVNTDPFEFDEEFSICTPKSSKWTLRDDIQHIQITNSTILHESYTFGEFLGQGSFGKVVSINDKTDDQAWAMKIIPKTLVPAKMNAIRREIQILRIVTHPNIILLHKIFESSSRIYLILEKCTGELGKLFKKCKQFSEMDARTVVTQLATVVDYLHRNDIVHRDLKLENILLAPNPFNPDDNLFIKVTDFGLGIVKGAFHEMLHDRCGTLTYLSPEILTKGSYSQQCDVWAMGVIMFLLLYGRYPFYSPTDQKLVRLICDYDPDYSHIGISDAAVHLMGKMLTKDPALRITAAEVKLHAWIVGSPFDKCKHENVLEMMKMWRSDMMLPQGTDCDWVLSKRSSASENNFTEGSSEDGSQIPQSAITKTARKESLKIPIHNIEFDRLPQRKQKFEKSGKQKNQTPKNAQTHPEFKNTSYSLPTNKENPHKSNSTISNS